AHVYSTLTCLFDVIADEEVQPSRFCNRELSYGAIRRFMGRETLRPFLQFAKLPSHTATKIVMILHGHQMDSFHYFLFPDLLPPHQLSLWGIPYGVAIDLCLHAEAFYLHLVNRERSNGTPQV
ncbi:hypothetical protein DFH28DRAFT_893113, partial [Melampsora americana]